jgi:hypothetical protein
MFNLFASVRRGLLFVAVAFPSSTIQPKKVRSPRAGVTNTTLLDRRREQGVVDRLEGSPFAAVGG